MKLRKSRCVASNVASNRGAHCTEHVHADYSLYPGGGVRLHLDPGLKGHFSPPPVVLMYLLVARTLPPLLWSISDAYLVTYVYTIVISYAGLQRIMDKQTHLPTENGQKDRQTERHKDRRTGRRTNRQTDKVTDIHPNTQTDDQTTARRKDKHSIQPALAPVRSRSGFARGPSELLSFVASPHHAGSNTQPRVFTRSLRPHTV